MPVTNLAEVSVIATDLLRNAITSERRRKWKQVKHNFPMTLRMGSWTYIFNTNIT